MQAIKEIREHRKGFKDIEKKNQIMSDCAICLVPYTDDAEVSELNCDERHYFHSECLEAWLKKKPECPLCKRPVIKNME